MDMLIGFKLVSNRFFDISSDQSLYITKKKEQNKKQKKTKKA